MRGVGGQSSQCQREQWALPRAFAALDEHARQPVLQGVKRHEERRTGDSNTW